MSRLLRHLRRPVVIAGIVVIAAAGVAVAVAAGGDDDHPGRSSASTAGAHTTTLGRAEAAPAPGRPCTPRKANTHPGPSKPPSDALLNAFGVLRRDRTAADALPREALHALRIRGLSPLSPDAARLLRTAPGGGKAWIVPVPDVDKAMPFARCGRPREGLAVVATGRAGAGGGGAMSDIVRGRAPVSVDPCAGPNGDMLGVSGVVPDDIKTVFLTAPDGTAVRTDVQDSGFAFVVARAQTAEPRYVVWNGTDGAPHVQPIGGAFAFVPGRACKSAADAQPRVTPDGLSRCGYSALTVAPGFPGDGAPRFFRMPVPGPVPALPAQPQGPRLPAPVPVPAVPRVPGEPGAGYRVWPAAPGQVPRIVVRGRLTAAERKLLAAQANRLAQVTKRLREQRAAIAKRLLAERAAIAKRLRDERRALPAVPVIPPKFGGRAVPRIIAPAVRVGCVIRAPAAPPITVPIPPRERRR